MIFLASTLTLTGIAVCAGIGFASAVFAACMDTRPSAGLLILGGLSGLLLAVGRPSALLYMAAVAAVAFPLLDPGVLLRPAMFLALLLAAAAAALEVSWNLNHPVTFPPGGTSPDNAIPFVLQQLPDLAGQLVGAFLPLPPLMTWTGLLLLLAAAALLMGRWRDRLALLAAAAAAVVVAATVQALVLSPVGWALQGRYILAAAA